MMRSFQIFRFCLPVVLVLAALSVLPQAYAQPPFEAGGELGADRAVTGLPDRIIRPMRATDPMTLKAEGVNIRLWGIKPAQTPETPLELKALDLMDSLINDLQVNCKIVGGAVPELVARCATQDNQDLALQLLGNGFVVVDRQQTYNSVFATGYEKAQESARLKGVGVWKFMSEGGASMSTAVPKWLRPHMEVLLPLALIFGPFAGLVVIAGVMHLGLRRLGLRQEKEAVEIHRKDAALQLRERQVLISMIEGELAENKNKIDAFLAVYSDMLRGLQNPVETPKYQQAGDIVQKHPAFSKAVFEANVGRLSLLNIKAAGLISKLYSSLPKEQEYINLEPQVPLETAVKLIQKILHDASDLLLPIEQVLRELEVVSAQKVA
jgi:endonuclease YncB( thermonuclease family)